MKNELIITDDVNNDVLNLMIDTAFAFYRLHLASTNELKIIKTDIGYDIEYYGIELGSYGIRKTHFLKWIYGTGCAEPRLSKLITYYDK